MFLDLIQILLFFIIPSNILLLVFLKLDPKNEKLEKSLTLVISYGIAPLLSGLLFYYLIWLLPNKENLFYISFIIIAWTILALFHVKYLKNIFVFYKNITKTIKEKVDLKKMFYILLITIVLFIFTFQIFAFPIVEGDSANYVNQSKALYETKNLNYENKITIINENDDYIYNPMIRPGIPSFLAMSFSFNGDSNNYFVYTFLLFFYYILLLSLFLFLVKELAIKLRRPMWPALFFGSVFFVFSWTFTEMFILGAKESAIYFLTLVSIYLVYKLISLGKRDIALEITAGITIGLNTFINVHGIIISLILFLLLAVFSKLVFQERIRQLFIIFVTHLFFGAFEFIFNFRWILFSSIEMAASKFNLKIGIGKYLNKFDVNITNYDITKIISNRTDVIKIHKDLYQTNDLQEMYLKGKLQILTNIGIFGFSFWLFLLIILTKIKEIFTSKLGKLIILFLLLYIFIVIDPININRHPMALILWGSAKYASLALLLSMIIVSVYVGSLINRAFGLANKESKKILPIIVVIAISLLIFKDKLISFGLKILSLITPFYKDTAFYQEKVGVFLSCFILALIFFSVVSVLIAANKLNIAKNLFVLNFIFIFILAPFFMTSVGKIPLEKTFSYIGKSQREKLEKVSNLNDVQKVYFFAKDNLPEGTTIETSFNEIYIYDNYFHLTVKILNEAHYKIGFNCDGKIMYSVNKILFCKTRNF